MSTIRPIEETFTLIRNWGTDRNLIEGATPQSQFTKLMEEFSEFTTGFTIKDRPEIIDGLGDSIVVMTIIAAQLSTSIENAITYADNCTTNEYEYDGVFGSVRSVSELIHVLVNYSGLLATGINKKDMTKVHLGIGFAFRTLETIGFRMGLNIDDIVSRAYDVIKDRKGRMIDGVFVKEADLANYGVAS